MRFFISFFIMLYLFTFNVHAGDVYKIGVLAKRGNDIALKKWKPTADFLSDKIKSAEFVIVPLSFDGIKEAVKTSQVDFVIANPALYTELEYKYGVSRIATMMNKDSYGNCITDFGGVIFTSSKRSDILKFNDLKGKVFGAVDSSSLGGWTAALTELKRSGINPDKSFKEIKFLGTHDNVVYAVEKGTIDAGTVRTDVLERMAREGKIELSDFYVINNKKLSVFHNLLSTELYPEWPFAMMPGTEEKVANMVTVALLQMTPEDEAAIAREVCGYTVPKSYERVHANLKYLQKGPYALSETTNLKNFYQRYSGWVYFSLIFMSVLLVCVSFFIYLNFKLRKLTSKLHEEIKEHEITRDELEDRQIEIETMNEELEKLVDEKTGDLMLNINALKEYNKVIDESNMVLKCTLEGNIKYMNDSLSEFLQFNKDDLSTSTLSYILRDAEQGRNVKITAIKGGVWKGFAYVLSGFEEKVCDVCFVPVLDGKGNTIEIVGTFNDVTELVQAQKDLKERLYKDMLTGLPNRNKLLEDLSCTESPKVAVLRLDSFDIICDLYGFKHGDTVIKNLSGCLLRAFSDTNINIYRLYGDKFALLCGSKMSLSTFVHITEGVIADVKSLESVCASTQVYLSFTFGAGEGSNALSASDIALHEAIEGGKRYYSIDNFEFYEKRFKDNLLVTNEIKSALSDDRIIPYYQPIYDVKTGEVTRFECLMRMVTTDGRVLKPFEFLETAKATDLYQEMTKAIWTRAVENVNNSNLMFSVNISYHDIADERTTEFLLNALGDKDYGGRLIVEIVESESIKNFNLVKSFISSLKLRGVGVYIDDFGSGYSNFEHILKLEIDAIKIDGSLIKNIVSDKKSRILVENIVNMADKLGFNTIAEFVSDEEVYQCLKDNFKTVRFYQGYYIGEPKESLGCCVFFK